MQGGEVILVQILESPAHVEDLDLMKLLKAYAVGEASWKGEVALSQGEREACGALHSNIRALVAEAFGPLLDRIHAREMETFTAHDRTHSQKVAHLMWHILGEARRNRLTPPEIALLVLSAYLHDLGMAVSPQEREHFLAQDSDLWSLLDVDSDVKQAMHELRDAPAEPESDAARQIAVGRLVQAEEALLAQYVRERHASETRYAELLSWLEEVHATDPVRIPDVPRCLSYQGDSFRQPLIRICVSHGTDADSLASRDPEHPERPLFRTDYPIGGVVADLRMAAVALRLADILDFDRERTPAILFHYLLPGRLTSADDKSVLEWQKHMTITAWHIDDDAIVYHGQCHNHLVHHAIVQFAKAIQEEIMATLAIFTVPGQGGVPVELPRRVTAQIHEIGYTYVPYQFELDDARVYQLLMGKAIYDHPLVAIRELLQNAVDACKLKDAMVQLSDASVAPTTENRITITYDERAVPAAPQMSVRDTGTGMDRWVLERYFLKVGRSYYSSSDFNTQRVRLRAANLDFAPISEFGIGFLSSFLLADRVVIETAAWEPMRGEDMQKRTLTIDGPTRLIRVTERANTGASRFRGTQVTLMVRPCLETVGSRYRHPSWEEVRDYTMNVCDSLPYPITLVHLDGAGSTTVVVDPRSDDEYIARDYSTLAVPVAVDDPSIGISGKVWIYDMGSVKEAIARRRAGGVLVADPEVPRVSALTRGGFVVSEVPGLPEETTARIAMRWERAPGQRFGGTNLARSGVPERDAIARVIARELYRFLLRNQGTLSESLLAWLQVGGAHTPDVTSGWLAEFPRKDLYTLGRPAWARWGRMDRGADLLTWENGRASMPLPSGRDLSCLVLLALDDVAELALIVPGTGTGALQVPGAELRAEVLPPAADWRQKLERVYEPSLSVRRHWLFARYDPLYDGLVYAGHQAPLGRAGYLWPKGVLNGAFRDNLVVLDYRQLGTLVDALADAHRDLVRGAVPRLGKRAPGVLRLVVDSIGDVQFGGASPNERWPISALL